MNSELKKLSEKMKALQAALREFGVEEFFIGGASSIALLDHVWYRADLVMRDLDIYVVRGQKVDESWARALAARLESKELGALASSGVTPHIRGNPHLAAPDRYHYQSGWGFDLLHSDVSFDLTLYHSEAEISLNGLFDCDMVKIRMRTDQSLRDLITEELNRFSYDALMVKGVIYDPHGGYASWKAREANLKSWHEVERDPVVQTVRVVRTLGKLGYRHVPAEIMRRLRPQIERRPEYSREKLEKALRRVENDPWVTEEKRMLRELGFYSLI